MHEAHPPQPSQRPPGDASAAFQRIFEAELLAMASFDADGSFRDANDAFLRLTGYDRADLGAGLAWAQLAPRDLAPEAASALGELRRRAVARPREIEILRKDGSRASALAGSALDDTGGGVVFLLDISDRKAAERERAESLAREHSARAEVEETQRRIAFLYQVTTALFEDARGHRATLGKLAKLLVPHLADWCLIDLVDEDRTERIAAEHWNPDLAPRARELSRAFPLDPAAPRGLSAVVATGAPELVPEAPPAADVEPEDVAALRRVGARSWMILPLRVRGRTRAVMTVAFSDSVRRYTASDLALAEDLAARAAMALENAMLFEEVERAVRAREDTLSIVSHDLKNPMSALLLGIQRMSRFVDASRRAQAGALLGRMERTVEGMNRLIEGLLELARIEAGRLQLERRPGPVAQVVVRALEPLEPLVAERSQRLELELPADLPAADWDPDRIAQVLANLVGNAVKFTPERGTISVRAARDHGRVRFEVRDDGPGIPADQIEHLFDRYWQPDGGQKRGHGLGLFIVKGIVEAHGGQVWVESTPGAGSTFFFTVPAAERASP